MDVFSIDFTPNELSFLRQSLEIVTISGKDAKFLANLQTRLESELSEINELKKQEELRKLQEIQQIQLQEAEKTGTKKKP